MSTSYYYGVQAGWRAGHHTWEPGGRQIAPTTAPISPWGVAAWALPVSDHPVMRLLGYDPEARGHQPQPEGVWTCVHADGWTLLAAWDRSADPRGGSLSAFVFAERRYTPTEAEAAARAAFPAVCMRIDAHLVGVRGAARPWVEVSDGPR